MAWGPGFKFKHVVEGMVDRCRDVLKIHLELKDCVFLVDDSFKTIVIEMLSCKQKVKSHLNWYLRDPSVSLH